MVKRWHGVVAALSMLLGCAELPAPPSRAILDTQTGNTLLLVTHPLVFARRRADVAAEYTRDYATLVAVELDVAGNYTDYLLLYRWSTVDTRMSPPPDLNSGELEIAADGRDLTLVALPQLPLEVLERDDLYYPQHAAVVTYGYKIDLATLRFIALSRRIAVRLPRQSPDIPFELREDGRASLAQFVKDQGVVK